MSLPREDKASEGMPLLPLPPDDAHHARDAISPRSSVGQSEAPDASELSQASANIDSGIQIGKRDANCEVVNENNETEDSTDVDTESDIEAKQEELRRAIQTRDLTAVTRLLDEGVSLACRDRYLQTPLHVCIVYYWYPYPPFNEKTHKNVRIEMEIILKILHKINKSENKKDILESLDIKDKTPLNWAICYGNTEVIKVLIEHGASVDNISQRGESALHEAVRRPEILEFLLNHYDIKNSKDCYGYTALHAAAQYDKEESLKLLANKFGHISLAHRANDGSTVLHVAARHGSVEIVEMAIDFVGSHATDFLNMLNSKNETAFITAIKECNKDIALLLIRKGAVLSEKDSQGRTAIENITKHFDNPLIFFENVLDESIVLKIDRIEEDHFEIHAGMRVDCNRSDTYVSYNKLTNSDSMSQIKVIEKLVRCGQKELLIHPVIESLLYLKWICLLPVIYTLIAIYAIFLVSLNTFLATTLYKRDSYNASACNTLRNGTDSPCFDCLNGFSWIWITFIYLSIFLMLAQECGYIYVQKRHYFVLFESWVKLCLFALAAVVTPAAAVSCAEPAAWLRHAASAALLMSWLQAMLLLSRFPDWGYYVLMIERVAYNVFKILLTSVCLLIGFSLSFMIEFHSSTPFEDPGAAFVKTLVMMTSEFDYEDLFEGDVATVLQDTKPVVRLLFVTFVIFIAIVLMNFMIGVAVSDINALNVVGNIRRLEKQVELQISLIDSPLVKLIVATGDLINSPFVKFFNRYRCCKDNNRGSFWLDDIDLLEQGNGPEPQDGSKISRLSRREYHYKMYKSTESDEKWHVLFREKESKPENTFLIRQSLRTELQNAIINVGRKNVQKKINEQEKTKKKDKFDALVDALSSLNKQIDAVQTSNQDMQDKFLKIMRDIKTIKHRTNGSHRKTRKQNKYKS